MTKKNIIKDIRFNLKYQRTHKSEVIRLTGLPNLWWLTDDEFLKFTKARLMEILEDIEMISI